MRISKNLKPATPSWSNLPRPGSVRALLNNPGLGAGNVAGVSGPTVTVLSVNGPPNPLARGTAQPPYANVDVTWPDGSVVTATADANGAWNVRAGAPQTSGRVLAVSQAQGRISAPAGFDYVDPNGPVVTDLRVTGTPPTLGVGNPPCLEGRTGGARVTVTWPDGIVVTSPNPIPVGLPALVQFRIAIPPALPSGEISVIADDGVAAPATRRGPPARFQYVDITPPVRPILVVTDPSRNGCPRAAGNGAEPGATATVTWPDGSSSTAVVDALGAWQADSRDGQPAGDVIVVITDPAGNVSPSVRAPFQPRRPAPPRKFVVDDTDRDGKPWAQGTAAANVTIKITWPDGRTARTKASASGWWLLKATDVQPTGSVLAVVVDDRGNSSASRAFSYQRT